MISKVLSSAVMGVDGYIVVVEVDIASGLPQFTTVGLPEAAVRESKERVRSAIKNCKYDFPQRRITVNLAPADIKKQGSTFDLPISIGILSASGLIKSDLLKQFIIIGELSLDGKVKRVKGVLSSAICAKNNNLRGIIIPKKNAGEASVVEGIDVIGIDSMQDVVDFLTGNKEIQPAKADIKEIFKNSTVYDLEFEEVKGTASCKEGH